MGKETKQNLAIVAVIVSLLALYAIPLIATADERRAREAQELKETRAHQLRVIAAQRGCDCACNEHTESKGGE